MTEIGPIWPIQTPLHLNLFGGLWFGVHPCSTCCVSAGCWVPCWQWVSHMPHCFSIPTADCCVCSSCWQLIFIWLAVSYIFSKWATVFHHFILPLDCDWLSVYTVRYWFIECPFNYNLLYLLLGLPCSSDGKESACSAGGLGSIPGLGRSSGGGHGKPVQSSCLENPMDQRSLADYIQSEGSQRAGHDWATNTTIFVKKFRLRRYLRDYIII